MLKIIVHPNIGSTDIRIFTCSTCVTVHSLHAPSPPPVDFMHALSKNLNLSVCRRFSDAAKPVWDRLL